MALSGMWPFCPRPPARLRSSSTIRWMISLNAFELTFGAFDEFTPHELMLHEFGIQLVEQVPRLGIDVAQLGGNLHLEGGYIALELPDTRLHGH